MEMQNKSAIELVIKFRKDTHDLEEARNKEALSKRESEQRSADYEQAQAQEQEQDQVQDQDQVNRFFILYDEAFKVQERDETIRAEKETELAKTKTQLINAQEQLIKNLSPSHLDNARKKEFFQWKKTSYNDAMLSNLPKFNQTDNENKIALFEYLNQIVDSDKNQLRAQNWGLLDEDERATDANFPDPKKIIEALKERKNTLSHSEANVTIQTTTTNTHGCTITREIVKLDELLKNLPNNEVANVVNNGSSVIDNGDNNNQISFKNTKLEKDEVVSTKFTFQQLENAEAREGYLIQDAKGKVTNPTDMKNLTAQEKSIMAYEQAFSYLIMNDPKKTVYIKPSKDRDYDRMLVASLYLLRGDKKLDIITGKYSDGTNIPTCANSPGVSYSYGVFKKDLTAEKEYITKSPLQLSEQYLNRNSPINKDAQKNIAFLQTHKAERTAYFKDQLKAQTKGQEGVKSATFGLDREIKLENKEGKMEVKKDTDVIEGPKP